MTVPGKMISTISLKKDPHKYQGNYEKKSIDPSYHEEEENTQEDPNEKPHHFNRKESIEHIQKTYFDGL
jgi:hypothetical protein